MQEGVTQQRAVAEDSGAAAACRPLLEQCGADVGNHSGIVGIARYPSRPTKPELLDRSELEQLCRRLDDAKRLQDQPDGGGIDDGLPDTIQVRCRGRA